MCAVGLHMLLSSCFPVDLILLVENCVAVLHRQNCCHVGPAAVTASLLLLQDFQHFSFNSEVLQLICMISWTKPDHNSQRNYTVLAGNYETKDTKYFFKALLTYIHSWAKSCRWWVLWHCRSLRRRGCFLQSWRAAPEEREEENEATPLQRSGALQDGDRGEEAACCDQRSQPSSHLQKKQKKINHRTCKHRRGIGWSIQGCLSSR